MPSLTGSRRYCERAAGTIPSLDCPGWLTNTARRIAARRAALPDGLWQGISNVFAAHTGTRVRAPPLPRFKLASPMLLERYWRVRNNARRWWPVPGRYKAIYRDSPPIAARISEYGFGAGAEIAAVGLRLH